MKVKTISSLGGYSMACNYMIGTGVLALPIVFYSASITVSVLITLGVSLLSGLAAFWINETTARGWALMRLNQDFKEPDDQAIVDEAAAEGDEQQSEDRDLTDDEEQQLIPASNGNIYMDEELATPTATNTVLTPSDSPEADDEVAMTPDYYIPVQDVLQLPRLCTMFLGPVGFYIYQFCVIIYLFSTLWGYASVVASSLTSNFLWIPQHFGIAPNASCNEPCSYPSITEGPCVDIYLLFTLAFALISLILGMIEVSDQALLQMFFTAFRYIVMALMIATVGLAFFIAPFDEGSNQTRPYFYPQAPIKLTLDGLSKIVPGAVFSQVMHHSAPVLLQPVRNKKRLNLMFGATFGTAAVFYTSLAVICALFLGPKAHSLVSLNWATWDGKSWTSEGSRGIVASAIAQLIILFPAVSLISSSPLNAITLSLMLMELLPKRWVDGRYGFAIKYTCRVLAIVPPIIIAALIRCLTLIVQICGLTGFAICYFIPPALQIVSQRRIKQRFGDSAPATPYSGWHSHWIFPTIIMIVGAVFFVITAIGIVNSQLKDHNLPHFG